MSRLNKPFKVGKHAAGRHKYQGEVIRRDSFKPSDYSLNGKSLLERAEAGEPLSDNEKRRLKREIRAAKARAAARETS